jgi:hypothetical protein
MTFSTSSRRCWLTSLKFLLKPLPGGADTLDAFEELAIFARFLFGEIDELLDVVEWAGHTRKQSGVRVCSASAAHKLSLVVVEGVECTYQLVHNCGTCGMGGH